METLRSRVQESKVRNNWVRIKVGYKIGFIKRLGLGGQKSRVGSQI